MFGYFCAVICVSKCLFSQVLWISTFKDHSAAVTESGDLYTWGNNEAGKLCLGEVGLKSCQSCLLTVLKGDNLQRNTPVRVRGAIAHERVMRVAAGGAHTLILTSDGKVS